MTDLTKQQALFEYTLRLGDNALILGHRLSEWCGHGPFLEEDVGIINTALDLLGQARMFLTYAGEIEGKNRSEDDFAYARDEREWRNFILMEQPKGDFAYTTVRQYLVDVYNLFLFEQLEQSSDTTIAAIAAKAIKETRYHVRHTGEWVVRLGDGTPESHDKMQAALNEIWRFTDEMFRADAVDMLMLEEGIGADLDKVRSQWEGTVRQLFERATLSIPDTVPAYGRGRDGYHSEYMGYLLAEMQFLQRAYPGSNW